MSAHIAPACETSTLPDPDMLLQSMSPERGRAGQSNPVIVRYESSSSTRTDPAAGTVIP